MRTRTVQLLALAVTLLLTAVLGSSAVAAVPAWTTYRHDGGRSGIDPDSTSPVAPSQVWQTPQLDGEIYAQPLVYGSYVYAATENDSIYKLDASTGAVVWSRHLGTPEPSSVAPCGDIDPTIGITSTPVIDPSANRIYAVGAVSDGVHASTVRHQLFALDLSSGQPAAGFPVGVDPPIPNGGAAVNQLQRAGLALDGGRILIGYGGNDGDCNTYWGWLVSAPTDGTNSLGSFQVDRGSGHDEGAIWAAGNAPAVDAAGNVFLATGNGNGNSTADPEYGDSVVKLNAYATPLDWWAPTNWQSLDTEDLDLGSSMPTLLPGGFLFQAGKDGNGYLLSAAALGHVRSAPAETDQFCVAGSFGGSVYDPGNSTIYVACNAGLEALSLGAGSPPSLTVNAGFSAPPSATGPPIIAGGFVWVTDYSSGTLYGLDPTSGTTRTDFSIPENAESNGSDVNHFAAPSAGGGRLFVGSGDQVTAFVIARPPGPTSTSTTLVASPNPTPAGAAVTLTASVSPAPDAGTVSFTDGGSTISGCSAIAVSAATGGQAICHVAFAQIGTHGLAASYSGDAFYTGSVSTSLPESVTSGAGSTGVAGGPRLSHVSISPQRFRAGRGTTLRLVLSRAATVWVGIAVERPGRRVAHRCRLQRHKGKRCLIRVTLRRLHFQGRTGGNVFKLRLPRLAPGRYTAIIYATDSAGRRSATVPITFAILRPRR